MVVSLSPDSWRVCCCGRVSASTGVNAVTADMVDFHSRHMLRCLSPTSVPYLACGRSGWPCCHLATQCHVWAGVGWGPLPSTVLHGWAPVGLGCGPRMGCRRSGWGLAADWSTLVVLRIAAEGKSCAFEVGTSESLFTQEGEGELSGCTRMPVSWRERWRRGMHSTIPTLSEPGQGWGGSHFFLFILAPSTLNHWPCLLL